MSVIIRPVISEKATRQSDRGNVYSFLVETGANKISIGSAVEQLYQVKVERVRTMVYAPRLHSRQTKRGLQVGSTNKLKKALVKLREGYSIDVFALS